MVCCLTYIIDKITWHTNIVTQQVQRNYRNHVTRREEWTRTKRFDIKHYKEMWCYFSGAIISNSFGCFASFPALLMIFYSLSALDQPYCKNVTKTGNEIFNFFPKTKRFVCSRCVGCGEVGWYRASPPPPPTFPPPTSLFPPFSSHQPHFSGKWEYILIRLER